MKGLLIAGLTILLLAGFVLQAEVPTDDPPAEGKKKNSMEGEKKLAVMPEKPDPPKLRVISEESQAVKLKTFEKCWAPACTEEFIQHKPQGPVTTAKAGSSLVATFHPPRFRFVYDQWDER